MDIKYTIIEQVIKEGRLEDTIEKYKDSIDVESIRYFSQKDPSGNNKYLEWMVKNFLNNQDGNASEIVQAVQCFHSNVNRLSEKHIKAIYNEQNFQNPNTEQKNEIERIVKTPKDINSYASYLWINPMCEYFEELKPATADRVKIWNNDRWELVSPLTHKASCKYGIHSNWCVSTANTDYFKRYTQDAVLIFWLDKKEKHPTRGEEVGNYKVAVNIKLEDFDKPHNWQWYSMEDRSIEPTFMLTILPKDGIEACKKYVKELFDKKGDLLMDFVKKIESHIIGHTKPSQNGVVVIPKMNEEGFVTEETRQFFDKLSEDIGIESYRSPGYYLSSNNESNLISYILLRASGNGKVNSIDVKSISNRLAEDNKEPNGTIKKSVVINELNGRDWFSTLPEDVKNTLLNLYIKKFNESKIQPIVNTPSNQLEVGDRILYKERGGSRWSRGVEVTVIRVTDKSVLLSNEKRIARTSSNTKPKYFNTLKIVDDTVNESRWIRKRII